MSLLSSTRETLTKAVSGRLVEVSKVLPSNVGETLILRTFGFLKVPLLFAVSPRVLELAEHRCVVVVPLNRRTKNHLNSMYFGALSIGADCAGGLIAMQEIEKTGSPVSLIFKSFHADFLKRAEGDVHFVCEDGLAIRELVHKAIESGERVEMPVGINALVPSKMGDEPVAKFTLTLSLKKQT